MGRVEARLNQLGLELPQPGANYFPFVRSGNLVFLAGQLSPCNGEHRFIGKLGREFGVPEGQEAARVCALNLLAHARVALDGDLDRLVRVVRVDCRVNSTPDFCEQSRVIDGASDLFDHVLGEASHHTRNAVGVSALPYDAAVEVRGTFEFRAARDSGYRRPDDGAHRTPRIARTNTVPRMNHSAVRTKTTV